MSAAITRRSRQGLRPPRMLGHATAGGPSGIVHGWFKQKVTWDNGRSEEGYATVCQPNNGVTDWPTDKWTSKPIDCLRCLKRLGRDVRVTTTRTVHEIEPGTCSEQRALPGGR